MQWARIWRKRLWARIYMELSLIAADIISTVGLRLWRTVRVRVDSNFDRGYAWKEMKLI